MKHTNILVTEILINNTKRKTSPYMHYIRIVWTSSCRSVNTLHCLDRNVNRRFRGWHVAVWRPGSTKPAMFPYK